MHSPLLPTEACRGHFGHCLIVSAVISQKASAPTSEDESVRATKLEPAEVSGTPTMHRAHIGKRC